MTRTVWITGAAGFTGRFLIEYLRNLPSPLNLIGLDLVCPPEHRANHFIELDLCDPRQTAAAVEQQVPHIVFHLAGLMPPHDETAMRHVNVDGSINLANALATAAITRTRLISAGSAAEYLPVGEPLTESSAVGGSSAYGRSKADQSSALLGLATDMLDVIIARPFNLLGPGLTRNLVAGALCEQFRTIGRDQGCIAPKGPIESIRDFIDIRDVVSAYWTLAELGVPDQTYNVCSGEGTSIAAIIEILEDEFGFRVDVRPDYDDAKHIGEDTVIGDPSRLLALGWRPAISLRRSLHDMVAAQDIA